MKLSPEQKIARYMRHYYSDENLAALLAHAQDGKLSFYSCCCFAGLPSAQHALQGEMRDSGYLLTSFEDGHDKRIDEGLPWVQMSDSFYDLGENDHHRRAKIVCLIKVEMDRREKEKSSVTIDLTEQQVSSIHSDLGERVTV